MLTIHRPATVDCFICPSCGKYAIFKTPEFTFEVEGVYGNSGIGFPFDYQNPDNAYSNNAQNEEELPQTCCVYEPRVFCDLCDQEMPQIDPDIFKLVRAMLSQQIQTRYSCSGHPLNNVTDQADDILVQHAHEMKTLSEVEDCAIVSAYVDFVRSSRSVYILHKCAMMAFEEHRKNHMAKACRFSWHIFPATTRYGVHQFEEPLSEFAVWFDAKGKTEEEVKEIYADMQDFIDILANNLFSCAFPGDMSRIHGHTGDARKPVKEDNEDGSPDLHESIPAHN